MKKLVCMNCGHRGRTWKPHDNVGEMFMDCRIRAPIASQEDAEAWWPVVRESDWCHEWTQPIPDCERCVHAAIDGYAEPCCSCGHKSSRFEEMQPR